MVKLAKVHIAKITHTHLMHVGTMHKYAFSYLYTVCVFSIQKVSLKIIYRRSEKV